MTTSDWIIDIALLLVVFRQMREERLTARTILLPLALVGWAASRYLHDVPTAGNDLVLIGLFTGIGVAFGVAGGLLTRVRYAEGHVRIKAGIGAAALWVISMGFRLGFAVWSSHASGERHLGHFSVAHDITGAQAWVAALILMAFGEVIFRLGTIVARGQVLSSRVARARSTTLVPGRDTAARERTRQEA
ncbi:hypothetical protein [Actinacidiphila epipremni]|jgi:heme/copper-type cytochrome/quinol oxidase subunit 1|uniref:DUF1453 domain-containing protein n=1 Tax=Actinacidiphila epipremni TaxID=2053013 RepID=A0ABX0ZUB1_9ACTN|nr:hypothetical protein [Actinacidiphila epipremni]NJP45208.1 hypothetical protein [Actinacidiphila epipremni]